MSREVEELNRRLLRARDSMDRAYADPLDVRAVAAVAHISEAHFIRCFHTAFGETPHRYLQRRRVERSMFLLRETERSVTDICFDVGFTSLGTFSRTFREIVGESPSTYRATHGPMEAPHCFQMSTTRPRVAAGAAMRPNGAAGTPRAAMPPRVAAGTAMRRISPAGATAPVMPPGSRAGAATPAMPQGSPGEVAAAVRSSSFGEAAAAKRL